MDSRAKLVDEQMKEMFESFSNGEWPKLHGPYVRQVLAGAMQEIERLRASQFRWTEVGDKLPGGDAWILALSKGEPCITRPEYLKRVLYTHWAPIPALPEKSEEMKDEELWVKYFCINPDDTPVIVMSHKKAFLAGLKAARSKDVDKP